ncbi:MULTISPECIES: Asp-tRNA(Asn)/Glu-tRNA(Gln) amidotransferase subunit GatC [Nioella]|jgi:aspartyl-tRNA(Asn)/glutamyl-tRNA(Gln) amidotransferase subunit C|uniref:Asp-tRNA(Asn)/Glu-tRNA(Gln) amidotransferase subunit GatC n=1 Tax=Nioella TaxID=1775424 RepID=UPI000FD7C5F6|nr:MULTISPECIES: Asp-tRNA(Asn)/Glu-tRNA(Gln) amidotransferase subunit GatC [Nioella]
MSIDIETAARVAKLARIKVEEEDLPALAGEFNAILGFIEQLQELNVDDVEPMTSVTPMRLKRREDVVTDGNQQAKVLANAPDAREGFFAVPKVVE